MFRFWVCILSEGDVLVCYASTDTVAFDQDRPSAS
jgi:hypothetical protein